MGFQQHRQGEEYTDRGRARREQALPSVRPNSARGVLQKIKCLNFQVFGCMFFVWLMNALCRDSTNRFWGDNKGSDAQKNQHANVILRRIFRESVWINVHLLPVRVLPLALIEACICSLCRKKKTSMTSPSVRFAHQRATARVGAVMGQRLEASWSHTLRVLLNPPRFACSVRTYASSPDGHEKGWKH